MLVKYAIVYDTAAAAGELAMFTGDGMINYVAVFDIWFRLPDQPAKGYS